MAGARPRRRKVRWTRVIAVLIFLAALIGGIIWAGVYAYHAVLPRLTAVIQSEPARVKEPAGGEVTKAEPVKTAVPLGRYINILMIGLDENGEGEGPQADMVLLVSINRENSHVNVLHIPRDTQLAVPGRSYGEKIAGIYGRGGSDMLRRTVQNLLPVHIHHTVVLQMGGFEKSIDLLGGVNVYVERAMNYEDPYAELTIQLSKGYQHVSGRQLSQYIRYRSDELGEISRLHRQMLMIRAVAEQTVQPAVLVKLPFLLNYIGKQVESDITPGDALRLASALKTFKLNKLNTDILPGKFTASGSKMSWQIDEAALPALQEKFMSGENNLLNMTQP